MDPPRGLSSYAFTTLAADRPRRQAGLATIEQEIRQTRDAIDRYLDAFEGGSMPETVCAPRVEALGKKLSGLEARQQELTIEDDADFATPSEDELAALAAEVRHVIENGDTRQKKAVLQRT